MNFSKFTETAYALLPENRDNHRCFHLTGAFYKKKLLKMAINKPNHSHVMNLSFPYINRNNENISRTVGLHSELACLLKLGMEDTSGLTFVNIRIDKNNKLNYSKPCRGCESALKQFGFKRIYYSNNEGKFEEMV